MCRIPSPSGRGLLQPLQALGQFCGLIAVVCEPEAVLFDNLFWGALHKAVRRKRSLQLVDLSLDLLHFFLSRSRSASTSIKPARGTSRARPPATACAASLS